MNFKKLLIKILVIYFSLELICFLVLFIIFYSEFEIAPKKLSVYTRMMFPFTFDPKTQEEKFYREPVIIQSSTKPPIILCGCSFAYGYNLEDEDTFAYKLANSTKRSVYNFAELGMGPQIMLYELSNTNLKNKIPICDYIIYVYIAGHECRTLLFRCWPFLPHTGIRYKLKSDNSLKKQILLPPISYSNIYRVWEYINGYKNLNQKYVDATFYRTIEESYRQAKLLYPNVNFIILNYSDDKVCCQEELEKLGIKIISLQDLTSENLLTEKYQISKYDTHPNKDAWNEITEKFIQKANIK